MRWLLTLLLLVAPTVSFAEGELAGIERRFGREPRATTEAALASLAEGNSPDAGRALAWLGALALAEHRYDRAEAWFREEARRFPEGPDAVLAWRGLGDVASARGRYGDAISAYEAALRAGATPPQVAELQGNARWAREARLNRAVERGCEIIGLACLLALVLRKRSGRPPLRALAVLAPVYALVAGVAWVRDPVVGRAAVEIALGSLLAVGLLGARRPRGLVSVALVIALHAAIIGAVVLHNDLPERFEVD